VERAVNDGWRRESARLERVRWPAFVRAVSGRDVVSAPRCLLSRSKSRRLAISDSRSQPGSAPEHHTPKRCTNIGMQRNQEERGMEGGATRLCGYGVLACPAVVCIQSRLHGPIAQTRSEPPACRSVR
jgi:hypothetical protein